MGSPYRRSIELASTAFIPRLRASPRLESWSGVEELIRPEQMKRGARRIAEVTVFLSYKLHS